MAPKKAPEPEPEPEPEAEAPPEPEEGEGIFYFPDNSKYGAPSTACTRMAAAALTTRPLPRLRVPVMNPNPKP